MQSLNRSILRPLTSSTPRTGRLPKSSWPTIGRTTSRPPNASYRGQWIFVQPCSNWLMSNRRIREASVASELRDVKGILDHHWLLHAFTSLNIFHVLSRSYGWKHRNLSQRTDAAGLSVTDPKRTKGGPERGPKGAPWRKSRAHCGTS